MKITKAILPVAGFGTRFLPATKSQPKEMLPIVDKPVVHYLVEEAVMSGIKEIVIVTGRGKRAIEDYFDTSWELEHVLVEKGKHNLLKEVRNIAKLAKFIYVRQPIPKGDGDGILQAKKIFNNEAFVILFGDTLIDGKIPATKQLINAFEQKGGPIIGVTEVEKREINQYGVVKPIITGTSKFQSIGPRTIQSGTTFNIDSLIEKPSPKKAPSNLAIVGKYIVTSEIFTALEKCKRSHDGELRLADAFRYMLEQKSPLFGHKFSGTFYDTGSKIGMLKAEVDFALKRKDIGPEFKQFLKQRV